MFCQVFFFIFYATPNCCEMLAWPLQERQALFVFPLQQMFLISRVSEYPIYILINTFSFQNIFSFKHIFVLLFFHYLTE